MAHPALIKPEEMTTFLEAVEKGDTMTVAAKKAGWSLTALYNRIDRSDELSEKLARARQVGTHARADQIDEEMDRWAHEENAAPSLRLARAKRWNPAYREKVEVTGSYAPQASQADSGATINLPGVLAIMAEAGMKLTLEPAGEADGPSPDVSGPALLPASSD